MTADDGILDPRWADALTLEQLGEIVAEWLEGRISAAPFYFGGPDPETASLIPVLAQLNRSGFVTDFSQPGQTDGQDAQRAAVSGYCEQTVAERLASISVREEFVVISQPACAEAWFELPITREENCTFTILAGNHAPVDSDDDWPWPSVHPEMRAVLLSMWHVDVCDPVWGRNDMLWPALTAAMMRSIDDVRGSLIDPNCFDASQD